MPFKLGPMELGLILVVVLIVFGVGKLPQVGGALGKTIREFRREARGDGDDVKEPELKEKAVEKLSTKAKEG